MLKLVDLQSPWSFRHCLTAFAGILWACLPR